MTIGHPDADTPGWPQHGRVVGVHHHIAAADRHSFDGGTDRVDVFITANPAVRQVDIRPAEPVAVTAPTLSAAVTATVHGGGERRW